MLGHAIVRYWIARDGLVISIHIHIILFNPSTSPCRKTLRRPGKIETYPVDHALGPM